MIGVVPEVNRSPGYLPFWKAIWNSFWNVDIGYFPLVVTDGKPESLASESIIREISDAIPAELTTSIAVEALSDAKGDDGFELALKLARESLDEVKKLTEYQDQKATRSLTISTFLAALSGAIFLKFSERYPLPPIEVLCGPAVAISMLLYAVYLAFALFVLCSASGALVVFHATRTSFKFPSPDPEKPERELRLPKSQIFFTGMIAVRPSAWAHSYADTSPGSPKATLRGDIAAAYFRNYVAESYLVAAKVADKVRYLEPAHDILSFGLRCLLVWLLLTAAVFVIDPQELTDTNVEGYTAMLAATLADDGNAASDGNVEVANDAPREFVGPLE